MNWVQLWKTVLLFTLIGYSLLVIVVSIGGFRNIVEMLRELSPNSEPDDHDPGS